jgi:hypothetical protein
MDSNPWMSKMAYMYIRCMSSILKAKDDSIRLKHSAAKPVKMVHNGSVSVHRQCHDMTVRFQRLPNLVFFRFLKRLLTNSYNDWQVGECMASGHISGQ